MSEFSCLPFSVCEYVGSIRAVVVVVLHSVVVVGLIDVVIVNVRLLASVVVVV